MRIPIPSGAAGRAGLGYHPAAAATTPAPPASIAAPGVATARRRVPWRVLGLLGLTAGGAVVLYLIRPGALTDDTYAFLDWGRDLRHGYLPLLGGRAFHPVPIVAGAVLSMFGSAAPTLAVMLSLAALILLAAGAWRAVQLLGFGHIGGAVAAALVITSPLLSLLAQVGYINLPFATLIVWALVFELDDRRAGTWSMLVIAGLVRPEGWAFLLAYGAWDWWRAGRPLHPRRWLPIAVLALGPMLLWLGLEWRMFGDALYSLNNTQLQVVKPHGNSSVSGLWGSLRFAIAWVPLIASAVGAVAVAWLSPRRLAATTLAATVVAGLTVLVLAHSKLSVPSRHFSAVVALLYVLAGAGAVAPARLLARRAKASGLAVTAVGLAGAAVVLGLAASPTVRLLRRNFKTQGVSHQMGATLDQTLRLAPRHVDIHGARRHTVAMVGAVDDAQLVWGLGVPFNAVIDRTGYGAVMFVEPTVAGHAKIGPLGLTNRARIVPPPGFHRVVVTHDWEIWVLGRTPVHLSDAALSRAAGEASSPPRR